MFRKIFTIFLVICFICVSTSAASQELENEVGKVASINAGDEAPFSGILLDSIAGAKFIAKSKYCSEELELKIKKEFETELVNKQLAMDLLRIQYNTLKNTHEQFLVQKEKEIVQLNEIIKDEVQDHSHWWFAGGILAGVLLSIGIFYTAIEVQN